jgi:AcrR family transcriptional regulator
MDGPSPVIWHNPWCAGIASSIPFSTPDADNDAMATSSTSDLAQRLLDIAYDITSRSGPAALSLREVQRQAGVSAATAYWHYQGRADLLLAVSRRATGELANALVDAIRDPFPGQTSDLFAVCLAYMNFARDHEGLFQAVILNSSTEELIQPAPSARGRTGLAAFEVLQQAVMSFQADHDTGTSVYDISVHVWAACHGMAAILIDTPMAELPEDEKDRLRRHHTHFVLRSLSGSDGRQPLADV